MKKFLFVLSMLAVLLLAASCVKPSPIESSASTSAEEEAELAGEDKNEFSLINIKDGKTDYVIVAPLNCPSLISLIANEMKGRCYEFSSVHLWVKYDANYQTTPFELLLGNTNRPESAKVIAEIKKYDYAIRLEGAKLVITGGCAVATEYAAKIFMEKYMTSDNASLSIPPDINITGSMPAISDKLASGWNLQYFDASNGKTLPYRIYLPSNYDLTKEYPLFVFLHGMGNNGSDGISHTTTAAAEVLTKIISGYRSEFIIIAPQCPEGSKWVEVAVSKGSYTQPPKPAVYLAAALELIDAVSYDLPVDESRIYSWGTSMGAFACYDIITRNPDLFAAVVCLAGAGDPSKAYLAAGVPVWAFHSTDDDTVLYSSSKDMIDALTAAGNENAILTTLTSAGHNCTKSALQTNGLLDWMFSKTKDK